MWEPEVYRSLHEGCDGVDREIFDGQERIVCHHHQIVGWESTIRQSYEGVGLTPPADLTEQMRALRVAQEAVTPRGWHATVGGGRATGVGMHTLRIWLGPDGVEVNLNRRDITAMVVRAEIVLDDQGARLVRLDLKPDVLDLDLGDVEVYAETVVAP